MHKKQFSLKDKYGVKPGLNVKLAKVKPTETPKVEKKTKKSK